LPSTQASAEWVGSLLSSRRCQVLADRIGQFGFIEAQVGLPQGQPGGVVGGATGRRVISVMGLFLPEVAHVRGELVIHRVGAGGQAFAYPGDVLLPNGSG
jgi:hypothetical protein